MIYAEFNDNGRVAQAFNDSTVDVLPEGMVELTEEQFKNRFDLLLVDDELTVSPEVVTASIEALSESVRIALQRAIDDQARTLGFSGGNALMLYVGFENAFQPLAKVFATWEASVWVEANEYKAEVIAGTKSMLSGDQAVVRMTPYPT